VPRARPRRTALWTCPACGARFVTRNLAHSCIRRTVDDFFADKPAGGVALARAFIAEVASLGPVTLHPVKTRIALMVDVRFAAINRIGADAIRGHIWLRERHASDRFEKIEQLGADFLYHFEVSARRPIDAELRKFIRLGYAMRRSRTPRRSAPARRRRPPG
jgi:hypothetical protein